MTKREQLKKIDEYQFWNASTEKRTQTLRLKINELIDAHNALLALDEPREEYCCGKCTESFVNHSTEEIESYCGNKECECHKPKTCQCTDAVRGRDITTGNCSHCGLFIPTPVKEVREDVDYEIRRIIDNVFVHGKHTPNEWGNLPQGQMSCADAIVAIRSLLLTAKQEGAESAVEYIRRETKIGTYGVDLLLALTRKELEIIFEQAKTAYKNK